VAGVERWGWKLCEVIDGHEGWEAELKQMDRMVVKLAVEVGTHRIWRSEWSRHDLHWGRNVIAGAVYYTRSKALLNRMKRLGLVDEKRRWIGPAE
jgi:hypothetical protein